jgi:GTP-binding protein SAR1
MQPKVITIILARKLWREYFATGVDGVVFLVDAVDRERFPEAKKELDVRSTNPDLSLCCLTAVVISQALLTSEELANVPFLILGNKIDLGRAASEDDLRYQLGLYETYGKETKGERPANVRPIELYMCSVVRKMGYGDGFKWLAQFL